MTRRMPIHEDRIRPVLPSEALPPRSDKQDLTAQTQALLDLGVKADRADLIRHRTREGMAIARSKGKLRGKQPKLSDRQQHLQDRPSSRMRPETLILRSTMSSMAASTRTCLQTGTMRR